MSDPSLRPSLQKVPLAESIEQAVLLTTAGLFDGCRPRGYDAVGPLTRVGGLSVFLRAVLTLQRAGIREILVLAGPEEASLKDAIRKDRRVTVPIRWMPVREFPPEDPRTWKALGAEVRGACLLVGGRLLFSSELVGRLCTLARDGEPALVVQRVSEQNGPGLRIEAEGGHGIATDLIALPGDLLRRVGASEVSPPATPLHALVKQAVSEGKVRTITASSLAGHWLQEVVDTGTARAAESALINALDDERGGIVDKYLNRPLSRPFTLLFLALGLSPNAVTGVSILLGLVAAAAFAVGNYPAALVGALLLQLSAIVDCSDGDVARLTFSESEFGAKLDIMGDNVVHMAIFGGIAWGLFLEQASDGVSWLPLVLGAAAIIGTGLSLLLVRRAEALSHRLGGRDGRQAAVLDFILDSVANRDFTLIVLILALLGRLEWFLWLAAVGAQVFWIVLAWTTRPFAVSRA